MTNKEYTELVEMVDHELRSGWEKRHKEVLDQSISNLAHSDEQLKKSKIIYSLYVILLMCVFFGVSIYLVTSKHNTSTSVTVTSVLLIIFVWCWSRSFERLLMNQRYHENSIKTYKATLERFQRSVTLLKENSGVHSGQICVVDIKRGLTLSVGDLLKREARLKNAIHRYSEDKTEYNLNSVCESSISLDKARKSFNGLRYIATGDFGLTLNKKEIFKEAESENILETLLTS